MSHYYLACRIGREWYGLAIDTIREVLHILALRQLPRSDMTGVMTLREKVFPVVDLRQLLGVEDYDYATDTPIIALENAGKRLGVIIDEADDVIFLADEQIQDYSNGLIQGMAQLENRLLFILNAETLLNEVLEAKSDANT